MPREKVVWLTTYFILLSSDLFYLPIVLHSNNVIKLYQKAMLFLEELR